MFWIVRMIHLKPATGPVMGRRRMSSSRNAMRSLWSQKSGHGVADGSDLPFRLPRYGIPGVQRLRRPLSRIGQLATVVELRNGQTRPHVVNFPGDQLAQPHVGEERRVIDAA